MSRRRRRGGGGGGDGGAAVQAAEATSADDGDDDDVFTEPRSPAQRLIAMEKAKFHRMTSRKTLKRSRTRTTRKTRYGQVGAPQKKKILLVLPLSA